MTKHQKKTRVPKNSNSIVVQRKWTVPIAKSASDSGFFRSFKLSDFPNTDIASLFTEYKISKLKIQYLLVNAPNNNATFPTLYIAPQHYSSGTFPSSRDEVIQYRNSSLYQFGPSNVLSTFNFKPMVPMDANTTGKRFVRSPWLSTTDFTVPHYTNVEWISRYNSTTDPTHTIDLVVTATVLCKGTR
jgi:hypothetical protein